VKRFQRHEKNRKRLLRHSYAVILTGLFYCLLTSLSVASQPPTLNTVPLETATDFYHSLEGDSVYFMDETQALTVEEVLGQPESFSSIKTPYVDFGMTTSRLWLWSHFENLSDVQQKWRLDLNRQFTYEMDVYVRRENGQIERVLKHSEFDPFHARPINDNLLVVDISVSPRETIDVLIGYRSTSTTYLPIAIGTPSGVSKDHLDAALIDWMLNGALIAFMIFTIVMIPVIGWRLGISFSLYMLAGLLYVSHADGYTFQYLWPDYPALNDPLNLSFMLLMSVFGLSFARILFNFKETAARLDRFMLGMVGLSAVFAFLAFFFVKVFWFQTLAYALVPISTFVQITAGIIAFRRRLLGAKPYLFGALIVLSSMIYATIAHIWAGYFNLDYTLDYGHFALIAECFAFACAIVLRLIGLRNERDEALRAELSVTRDKLELTSKLQKAETDFSEAKVLAEKRRLALSSVSHDIRQPLSSLRLAMEKMEGSQGHETDQMHKAFDYLEDIATQHMRSSNSDTSSLIDGPAFEKFAAHIVLDNVHAMFKDEVQAKGLQFELETTDDLIRSDPLMLMRALNNLVANALHYTETGKITLKMVPSSDFLDIHVIDTGKGMTQEDLKLATQRHVKGIDSNGEGLGLSIVNEICQSLGAEFELDSTPEQGTDCIIRLQLEPLK
jgi:signal transduction histidine kinase